MPGLLVVHTPPPGALLSVAVRLMQIFAGPIIAVGPTSTVTEVVVKQPVPAVYVTLRPPAVIPVRTPAGEMVPTATLLVLQVPPGERLVRVIVAPGQT